MRRWRGRRFGSVSWKTSRRRYPTTSPESPQAGAVAALPRMLRNVVIADFPERNRHARAGGHLRGRGAPAARRAVPRGPRLRGGDHLVEHRHKTGHAREGGHLRGRGAPAATFCDVLRHDTTRFRSPEPLAGRAGPSRGADDRARPAAPATPRRRFFVVDCHHSSSLEPSLRRRAASHGQRPVRENYPISGSDERAASRWNRRARPARRTDPSGDPGRRSLAPFAPATSKDVLRDGRRLSRLFPGPA
jgi:hypothetical protein